MNVLDQLGKRIVFFDGGMGTLLQSKGLPPGEQPALWSLSHPEAVCDVHLEYLRAGSDILCANSFGANRLLLPEEIQPEDVVRGAIECARRAIDAHGGGAVALDIGPSGRLLAPYGDLPFEQAVEIFGEVVSAGAKAGADMILLETMTDSYEIKAALLAAKEYASLPILVSMTFDERAKLLTGADVRGMVALLESMGAVAVGCNCGLGPVQMQPIVREFLEHASVPVLVNPNAGLPEIVNGQTRFPMSPESFAAASKALAEMGAWLVGGCCGTTPGHIRALRRACAGLSPKEIRPKGACVVSSWGRSVSLDQGPVVIGERLNPTGKKRLKQALRDRDMDYLLREGLQQQRQGAHILDVNVGLPELDETALFREILPRLQAVIDLPLQIDSSSVQALEAALRIYNGKALINSVCGKRESLAAVLPLAKRYGGALVALTLDENGIPDTVEGRLAIARRIIAAAEAQGIPRKDILLDALTLPVSAQSGAARITLETLRRAKEELGVRTILGVSNVSFGLPQREALNASMLTLAAYAGLDAAIVNPGSEAMMQAVRACRALLGHDGQFADFLAAQSVHVPAAEQKAGSPLSLEEAVRGGLVSSAVAAVRALLQTDAPERIIAEQLMPALDAVGKGYESGALFLPQLLQSADAAKAAFEELQKSYPARQRKPPQVLLATVYGDVHDIGKNIVKVLLENYGFGVLDLGKNVPHEQIVAQAKAHGIRLIGLSALMTTTVPSMEEAIARIRGELPGVHVMVGGAVLTPTLAERIGADSFGRDGMAGVLIARRILGETQ